MDLADVVAQMGGVASRGALLRVTTRADVDRAIASGALVVVARGRYAVPGVEAAVEAAHRLSGVLSRESAALHHGWAVKTVPPEPHVSVADSALRAGESSLLARIAASARGPGAPQIRRVVDEASADAANPFESVLRASAVGAGAPRRPRSRTYPSQVLLQLPRLSLRPRCHFGTSVYAAFAGGALDGTARADWAP